LNNPEDSKPEEKSENEDKPFVDEETSYSFLFFVTSGALLFVTCGRFGMTSIVAEGTSSIKMSILNHSMRVLRISGKRLTKISLPRSRSLKTA